MACYRHMGLSEGESLQSIKRKTDQAGVEEQDNYFMGEDIVGKIHESISV